VDRLVDYCLHTPEDGLSSFASVKVLKKQIEKNLRFLEKRNKTIDPAYKTLHS